MNVHSASNTPPPYVKDLLLSTLGKQVCGSHDGDRIDIGPGPSVDEDREDQWDPNKAEASHEKDKKEETKGSGERDDDDTPLLLRFTKKRPLSFAKEKRPVGVVSNVVAFRHQFCQMRTTRRGPSRTSAAIHLPDPIVPQDLSPPLLTRQALMKIHVMMVRWRL